MSAPPRRVLSWLLVVVLVGAAVGGFWSVMRTHTAATAWPGVDEAVIGHFAEQAGRAEPAFSITWIEGDLLLFAFLWAGLLAGGVIGFYARILFVERRARAYVEPADAEDS